MARSYSCTPKGWWILHYGTSLTDKYCLMHGFKYKCEIPHWIGKLLKRM